MRYFYLMLGFLLVVIIGDFVGADNRQLWIGIGGGAVSVLFMLTKPEKGNDRKGKE